MHGTARTRTAATAAVVLLVLLSVGVIGWPGPAAAQNGDCELIRSGVLAQPVGAWTSLVFLPLGVWAAGFRPIPLPMAALFGAGFVAVGLASFAGHAAATEWARNLDSLAIKAMLVPFVIFPAVQQGRLREGQAVAVAVGTTGLLWIVELALPGVGRPLLVIVAAAAVVATVGSGDRVLLALGGALVGAGALLWWLGGTGGPLCDADSAVQMHGMWHILAAGGFLAIYRGFDDN